jgi:hypothetical protein
MYLAAVRTDRRKQEHCQGIVDIDPPLVRHRHSVDYRRSPRNLASCVLASQRVSYAVVVSEESAPCIVRIDDHSTGHVLGITDKDHAVCWCDLNASSVVCAHGAFPPRLDLNDRSRVGMRCKLTRCLSEVQRGRDERHRCYCCGESLVLT